MRGLRSSTKDSPRGRGEGGTNPRRAGQLSGRKDALRVPLEAVFEKEGRPIVYVARGRTPEPREVVLGPSNQDFVVIEKGLDKGERVFLRDPGAPPSDFGSLTSQ